MFLSREKHEESVFWNLTYQRILLISAIVFLILPFITTFNEFLTRIVENIGLYMLIQNMIVPTLVKMVGAILQYFLGVQTAVSSTSILLHGGGRTITATISWNCVGWQSLILFILTLITGLQGPYTLRSKLECLIIGFQGTFLINIGRIALVCLVALYLGYLPAIIFHDYGGTILILLYLAGFWYMAFTHILKRKEPEDSAEEEEEEQ